MVAFFKKYLILSLLTMLFAVSYSLVTSTNLMFYGSDFIALYSGAKMYSLNPKILYDLQHQLDYQSKFFNDQLRGLFLPFAYPPYFAKFLTIFSFFSFTLAKIIFVVCNIFLLIVAFVFFKKEDLLKNSSINIGILFLYFITLLPNFSAIFSGQTTLLVISCLTMMIGLVKSNKDVLASFALGCLAFKPQYYALAFLLCMVHGKYRVSFFSLVVVLFLYLITAYDFDNLYWPIEYSQFLKNYSILEASYNGASKISLFAFYSNDIYSFLLFSIVVSIFIYSFYKSKEIALIAPMLVMFSPHTMYYDFGICLVPLFFLKDYVHSRIAFLTLIHVLLFFVFLLRGTEFFRLLLSMMVVLFYLDVSIVLIRRKLPNVS